MLYMIGIGLGDEKDITVKGLEIVKSCDYIYLENYTNFFSVSVKDLEKFYGKKINVPSNPKEFLTNKPRPATPATAASPVFILKIALLTPFNPRLSELNARLVLSFAFISNCNLFLAIIFLTYYHDLTYRKKHTIS